MSRPAVEVADVLHAQGQHFLDQHPWLSVQQRTVLRALTRCRTAALGGHVDQCSACGHRAISYVSSRCYMRCCRSAIATPHSSTPLKLGLSRTWPEALEALTGSRQMDATAIRDYFAPLQVWLDEQLKGQPTGW